MVRASLNKANGSGCGQAFDNLSMVADLGHRITFVTMSKLTAVWCNRDCKEEITGLGVELYDSRHWKDYVETKY